MPGEFPLASPLPSIPSATGRPVLFGDFAGVGSEDQAGLRPPLKLHVRFSRMQLSRWRGLRPQAQRRNQRNQADQPQLAAKAPLRKCLPPPAAPQSVMMRPQPLLHPPVEPVEESPHMSAFAILAPLADQLRSARRDATPRLPANAALEPVDGLLRRVRVQIPVACPGPDLRVRQPKRSTTPLDPVAQKREPMAHMHNSRILPIEPHTQRSENLSRDPRRRLCLAPTPACNQPVSRPRELLVAHCKTEEQA
jgi:hypothetical protein